MNHKSTLKEEHLASIHQKTKASSQLRIFGTLKAPKQSAVKISPKSGKHNEIVFAGK